MNNRQNTKECTGILGFEIMAEYIITAVSRISSIICSQKEDPGTMTEYFTVSMVSVSMKRAVSLSRPTLTS